MEGGTNAAVLLGVDFEKAFNRMDHAVCLRQLKKLGASNGSLNLVKSFLENREMTMRMEGHCPTPVPILRGSPQGSVLGCLLYCITTQSFTDGLGHGDPTNELRQDQRDEGIDEALPSASPPRPELPQPPAGVPEDNLPVRYFPHGPGDSPETGVNFWDRDDEIHVEAE